MGAFEQIAVTMSEAGFEIFLPWLLVFSISYGLLNKYEFVSGEKDVNGVVSLAFAFLTVIGVSSFAPPGMWAHFAANIAFGMFGVLSLLILFAVAGYDVSNLSDGSWSLPWILAGIIGIVSFIGVIVGYGNPGQLIGPGENLFDDVIMPILALVFVLSIVAITSSSD